MFGIRAEQGDFVGKLFRNEHALSLSAPSREQIRRCLYIFEYLELKRFPHVPALL